MKDLLRYDLRGICKKKTEGISNRKIGEEMGIHRNTINKIINEINASDFSYADVAIMTDSQLQEHFLPKDEVKQTDNFYIPDWKKIAIFVSKPHHTVILAWERYVKEAELYKLKPYQITQFRYHLDKYLEDKSFAYVINRKAGMEIEVDWFGTKAKWIDSTTGERVEAYMFLGVLTFSGYVYCEAVPKMTSEWWIECHVNMFEYFNGTTPYLVPDNLKTGVKSHQTSSIVLNANYKDMARHYGMEIIPTRRAAPKDKPMAEGSVGKLTSRLIVELEDNEFSSIDEYNASARNVLETYNSKRFQKKDSSRKSLYEEFEKPILNPLPKDRYVTAEWKEAKVHRNSHIFYLYNYYSVPTKYVGKKVKLKIQKGILTIYLGDEQLAEHKIFPHGKGMYSTNYDHFPKHTEKYSNWDSVKLINWSKTKGQNVYFVVKGWFDKAEVEQTKYKSALGIIALGSKYGDIRLESACALARSQYESPTYFHIKSILEKKEDMHIDNQICEEKAEKEQGIFTRGGDYFNDQGK